MTGNNSIAVVIVECTTYNCKVPIQKQLNRMSSSLFNVTEHVIPCAHIREYRNGIKDETSALQLAIKEYRPLDNLDPVPSSVTIIATTPNAFPKGSREAWSCHDISLSSVTGMF